MLSLALRLGVAPLVAPAVDLTVVGLLLGTRCLTSRGADQRVIRPARRLLFGASAGTLVLNVADPLVAGQWGQGGIRHGGSVVADRLAGGWTGVARGHA